MTPEEINKLKDQYIKDLSAFVDYKLESEKELVQAKAIRDAEIHGLKQEIDSLKASYEKCMRIAALETKRGNEAEAQLQSLSSDTRTLEEVLDDCDDDELRTGDIVYWETAIKAMQEVERMARLKGLNEAAGYVEENLSLQQQLSEHEKQYLEMAKIAREAAEENERLKAELETAKHLNNVFRERLYKNSSLNDLDDGSMDNMKIVKSDLPSPPKP